MPDDPLPRPTNAELAILDVLWEQGPSTVRQVKEQLKHGHRLAYTTVLKQMQTLEQKGLVAADDRRRSHIYEPMITKRQLRQICRMEVANDHYAGSAGKMMLELMSDDYVSPEDIRALERMLRKVKGKK